jgi:prolyl 4-hydroxylase
MVILDDFVSDAHCEAIREELDFAFWTPSTVVARTRDGHDVIASSHRISETTGEEWFSADLRRHIRRIETRLCRLLELKRSNLEPWQATRYRRGGKFDAHFDGGAPFRNEPAGDREVTLLVYLSTPAAGGSTTFPELGLDVHARAGTVVAWTNLRADGTVDPNMIHAARPLRKGSKVTLTTWSRQRSVRISAPKTRRSGNGARRDHRQADHAAVRQGDRPREEPGGHHRHHPAVRPAAR